MVLVVVVLAVAVLSYNCEIYESSGQLRALSWCLRFFVLGGCEFCPGGSEAAKAVMEAANGALDAVNTVIRCKNPRELK